MCGLCGVVYADRNHPISNQRLSAMNNLLEHRGPDDSGEYIAPGIGLASRRLAILDLSSHGHMPMSTPDNRYRIAYNGEVYNFPELRRTLEARGTRFVSGTDTEVLLHLYVAAGPDMLQRLNGMFVFAIWDSVERTLFIARDRLGVKPLYYIEKNGALYFASEQKALFNDNVMPEFDTDTWEELLCFRYVSGARTPYKNVKKLLPGHYLMWRDGSARVTQWWNLSERIHNSAKIRSRDSAEWFRATFDDAVNLRKISDVPVGVLLSGGLDSGSVAASLSRSAGKHVASFTVRFDETSYDEGPLARSVADQWGLDYHELKVPGTDLMPLLETASWLGDEPAAHGSNLQLLAISRYAKQRVTVLLSGEGADENLGGYVRYQPLRFPTLLNTGKVLLPHVARASGLTPRVRKLERFLSLGDMERLVLFNACEVLPSDLQTLGMQPSGSFPYREQIMSEAVGAYPENPVRQAMYSDLHTFLCSLLDRNDRMTMGASIECRVPFLDYRLVEGLARMPNSQLFGGLRTKRLLRRAIGKRLPKQVLVHHKWGFAVPWSQYLRGNADLRDQVRDLPNVEPIVNGPFRTRMVRSVVDEFLKGQGSHDALVLQLAMIAIWYRSCITRRAPRPPMSSYQLV